MKKFLRILYEVVVLALLMLSAGLIYMQQNGEVYFEPEYLTQLPAYVAFGMILLSLLLPSVKRPFK